MYGWNTDKDDKMYSSNHYNDRLFPSRTSFFIFCSYITLFVSQGLLVTAVHKSQVKGFNPTVVVLLTELVKLLICLTAYMLDSHRSLESLVNDVKKNRELLLLYLVPSFLYCLYNNLTYINLELFDLTTYYCLMQFRIVLTAIIYQILFRRKLTLTQWISLFILTFGCLVKEYGLYDDMARKHDQSSFEKAANETTTASHPENLQDNLASHSMTTNTLVKFAWLTSLLLIQMFCSCFAGVYNEYLLKDSSTANNADIILQNIFMYFDSIVCNLVVYKLAPTPTSSSKLVENLGVSEVLYNLLTSPLVIVLIWNNALSGLVASFFLKSLNSILKTFASALELFAVAFFAWILFKNEIDAHTIVALLLVSAAMIVYSRNPVSTAPPGRNIDSKDEFILVPTTED